MKNYITYFQPGGVVTLGGKSYDTNTQNGIRALRTELVKRGYSEVALSSGPLNYGPKTRAALAKEQEKEKAQKKTQSQPTKHRSFSFGQIFEPSGGIAKSLMGQSTTVNTPSNQKTQTTSYSNKKIANASQNYSNDKIPSFDEYLYLTGGDQYASNLYDLGETFLGSLFKINTQAGDGTKRQVLAQMLNPIKTNGGKTNSVHYDSAKRYYGTEGKSVGDALKDMSWENISSLPQYVSNYTIGQNNQTSKENFNNGGLGWIQTDDGGYALRDTTDYHMYTIRNPNFDSSQPESKTNPKFINISLKDATNSQYTNRNIIDDIKDGIYNPMTLLENAGTRRGWAATREVTISPDEIENYRKEYEAVINDPEKLQKFFELRNKYQKHD